MQTARLYQPALVFAEDLDAVAEGGDVSKDQAAKILDIFDGVTAKGTELMVVLTTNHPERIHKGMLRPGRLDSVIEIKGLDRAGIEKLVRVSLPAEVMDPDINWDEVADSVGEMLPAYVREAADRAFRYVLSREGGDVEKMNVTTYDLVHAAEGLKPQLELMEGAKEGRVPDPLTVQIREAAKRGVVDAIDPDALDGAQERWLLRREVVAETQK
jgi:transitional endoplasmic reticulum ATPase